MTNIIGALLLAVMSLTAFAAESNKTHRVLFEFTSAGKEPGTAVLNNIENVRKSLGVGTQVILVAHGPGIVLLQKANNESLERMRKLADAGVVFAACENTMKRKSRQRQTSWILARRWIRASRRWSGGKRLAGLT